MQTVTYSCKNLSAVGPQFRPFHIKIAEVSWNVPLCVLPLPLHVSACVVNKKNYLKWQEVQLVMHCGVGNIIDFN